MLDHNAVATNVFHKVKIFDKIWWVPKERSLDKKIRFVNSFHTAETFLTFIYGE